MLQKIVKQFNKKQEPFSFAWLLFLGVLPFEKAALTLYFSSAIGNYLSLFLNLITMVSVAIVFLNAIFRTHALMRKEIAIKYILFFFVLTLIYLLGSWNSEFSLKRILSLACLLGYYLYVICVYKDIDYLLRDIRKALFCIMAVSLALYFCGNKNVEYIENASSTVFKGIAANRNSYSEISLLFIAINFYLYQQKKENLYLFVLTTIVAVYSTVLTNGVTSIICMVLLIALLLCPVKWQKKLFSFRVFALVYMVVFFVIVINQSTDSPLLGPVLSLFGKKTTLTGRTSIWATVINTIVDSPIWGHGYDSTVLLNLGIRENDPHNGLLYTMFTQGGAGVVVFIYMLFPVFKSSKNSDLRNNNLYVTLLIFLMVWFIRGLFESVFSYTHFVFWCALIVMEIISSETFERGICDHE